MLQGRYDQSAYDYARKQLELNLDSLFIRYRGRVEGDDVKALINVINTGKRMLSEIHFIYCPPIVLDFMLGKMDEQQKENNYHAATDMYNSANELISQLLEDKPDAQKIGAAMRTLKTTVEYNLSKTDGLNTALDCCSVFYNALITFAGFLTMGIGFVLSPISLGATLGLVPLGFFATSIGFLRVTRSINAMQKTGIEEAKNFVNAADTFSKPKP